MARLPIGLPTHACLLVDAYIVPWFSDFTIRNVVAGFYKINRLVEMQS
jgi:hypothetical protein